MGGDVNLSLERMRAVSASNGKHNIHLLVRLDPYKRFDILLVLQAKTVVI